MAEMAALEAMEKYGTLGPDFLTWLCVCADRAEVPAPALEPGLAVKLLGPCTLTSELGEATKVTLTGEEAAAAPELKTALKHGKRLIKSRVEFSAQDAKWNFTLDAETFDLKSVKLPVPKVPDLDEYMSLRIQALQHLSAIVAELFEKFLVLRLDPAAWRAELESWQNLN